MERGRRPSIEERLKVALAQKQEKRDRELGLSFGPNDSEGYRRVKRANAERKLKEEQEQQGRRDVNDQRAGGQLGRRTPAQRVPGSRTGGRVYTRPAREQAPEPVQPRETRWAPRRRSETQAPAPQQQEYRDPTVERRRQELKSAIDQVGAKLAQAKQSQERARYELQRAQTSNERLDAQYRKDTRDELVRLLEREQLKYRRQLSEIPPEA